MKQRKIPMRMCVACREMRPKRELVRLVCTQDGQIMLDETGKAPGRGAYICTRAQCAQRALKTRALERALEGKLGAETLERLNAFEPGEE